MLGLSPAIWDFTSVVFWRSEAANSVLVPAFCSSAGELLGAGGGVDSSALFTWSTLLATVSAAGFSLVSAATVLVRALATCRFASFGSTADGVAVSALLVATLLFCAPVAGG